MVDLLDVAIRVIFRLIVTSMAYLPRYRTSFYVNLFDYRLARESKIILMISQIDSDAHML